MRKILLTAGLLLSAMPAAAKEYNVCPEPLPAELIAPCVEKLARMAGLQLQLGDNDQEILVSIRDDIKSIALQLMMFDKRLQALEATTANQQL